MSDLIERLQAEQGRLQRVLDTKDINKARRRTLGFRLKMISQSIDALEAKDKDLERLTWVEKNHLQGIAGLEARIAELEAKGLAVLDSWENGNYDGDLDGNMLDLAEALGERDG